MKLSLSQKNLMPVGFKTLMQNLQKPSQVSVYKVPLLYSCVIANEVKQSVDRKIASFLAMTR